MKIEVITVGSPVKRHHIPRWFGRRINAAYGRGCSQLTYSAKLDILLARCGPRSTENDLWRDHWGSTRLPDGRTAWVSEPYVLPGERILALVRLASWLECELEITGVSAHAPGRTVRIAFSEGRP